MILINEDFIRNWVRTALPTRKILSIEPYFLPNGMVGYVENIFYVGNLILSNGIIEFAFSCGGVNFLTESPRGVYWNGVTPVTYSTTVPFCAFFSYTDGAIDNFVGYRVILNDASIITGG